MPDTRPRCEAVGCNNPADWTDTNPATGAQVKLCDACHHLHVTPYLDSPRIGGAKGARTHKAVLDPLGTIEIATLESDTDATRPQAQDAEASPEDDSADI